MNIIKTVQKQFEIAKQRNWNRIYWAVDLHSTLIYPNYDKMKAKDVIYYPHAMETMRVLSFRPDARLIMYSCSWEHEIEEYNKRFKSDNIHFDWVNKNPEVDQTNYGYYMNKPYFNVLLDDKAGFDPDEDWEILYKFLSNLKHL